MALPTPRDLLTSLLTTMSSLPAPSTTTPNNNHSNPLRTVPPNTQALLATLHVLFPSCLLPALDLLDRGLVAHVSLRGEDADQHQEKRRPDFYVVTSLASTMPRRGRAKSRDRATAANPKEHLVQLGAWNCSCPSFALDAFPPGRGGGEGNDAPPDDDGEGGEEAPPVHEGQVGGMSLDGTGKDGIGPDVPFCKHILACVLADRWPAMANKVVEKRVERAELARLVATI
jgi:hypothetical protein